MKRVPKETYKKARLTEDALRGVQNEAYRLNFEKMGEVWIEEIYSQHPLEEMKLKEKFGVYFEELLECISIDLGLLKLYCAIGFEKVFAEGVTLGMIKDFLSRVIREELIALNYSVTPEELKEVSVRFAKRINEQYRKEKAGKYNVCVKKAMDLIHFYMYHRISTNFVAEKLGMNLSTLAHLFKKETGQTVGEYILEIKLKEAQKRQREGIYSLSEISDLLGFSSYSYFSKRYKAYFGFSPSEFQ